MSQVLGKHCIDQLSLHALFPGVTLVKHRGSWTGAEADSTAGEVHWGSVSCSLSLSPRCHRRPHMYIAGHTHTCAQAMSLHFRHSR